MNDVIIKPSSPLKGKLHVPGDKSISHRAIFFSALAHGNSELWGLLRSEDVMATIACFQAMGVPIHIEEDKIIVEGVGMKGLRAPKQVLDCGNSGTTMRLMIGLLVAQPFTSRLTGDVSLNQRPMERVIDPLKAMGAHIEELRASKTERVIKITGKPLKAIRYVLPIASAQVKSAILIAGLFASGKTQIIENTPSRNHTEIMLKGKGAVFHKEDALIQIETTPGLKNEDLNIPGDISSAAFFMVGGLINPDSEISLTGVGVNPSRTGLLEVLQKMGGSVQLENPRQEGGEPVADLKIQASPLKGIRVEGAIIPRLIDEIPILAIAAARAQGLCEIRDASELRVKESDRLKAIAENFNKISLNIKELKDGLDIEGPQELKGGTLKSFGDHRIAMSHAIAGSLATSDSKIEGIDCVTTSYPLFWEDYRSLGGNAQFC